MIELKCPICGEKLVKWIGYADDRFWTCNNVLCEAGRFGHIADEYIWQELIRTRKALEIAVDALKNMKEIIDNYEYSNGLYYALDGHDTALIANYVEKAQCEITALEQKDVK